MIPLVCSNNNKLCEPTFVKFDFVFMVSEPYPAF